jgi:hypothetical protein
MSKALIGVTQFCCATDCKQMGCPGHELRLEMDCSTDTYVVSIDGVLTQMFDENLLHAIIDCTRAATIDAP